MKINPKTINIDYSRDNLFDELGMRRLKDSYMCEGENSPQERFAFVSCAFASNEAHAQRLYDYSSKQWLSFSTPLLSYGKNKKGLPISCYLSYIPDSAQGLLNAMSEICSLSMLGGGVGIGLGIRSEDSKSTGIMPHLKMYEAASLAYRQGETRRGSFAGYIPINHPNISQFIDMRKPTGDANQRCQELHHGVNITNDFMQIIENCMLDEDFDDSWELKDPNSNVVKEVVSAKKLWENILETRSRTGEPFLHFIDTSNDGLPEYQKASGLAIRQSNICTEITLATDDLRTAVCCLSSLNLEYWDKWKDDYQFYRDVAEMLDNALQIFIETAPPEVSRAVYSASRERAIGVGALGFHALLQQKGIPFESAIATSINKHIFKNFKKYLSQANSELASERGDCPDAEGLGIRFSHMIAIAPNATSSIIMGNTSPSIEAFRSNAYRQDTLSGAYLNKNKYLDLILKERIKDQKEYDKAWHTIVASAGSVQGLNVLNDFEKDTFKTASEIDQMWVIKHAADRNESIDQSQSVNLTFKADASISYLHHVHFAAWKQKLKTLYYCRSDKLYHGESMNKQLKRVKFDFDKTVEEGCIACE